MPPLANLPAMADIFTAMSGYSQNWFTEFLPYLYFGLGILVGSFAIIFIYYVVADAIWWLVRGRRLKDKFQENV